ncbi:MAG TPA: kelch repeat-containing protein [Planctomycetota bacterium]|nr:kelch repeat-containing protein [Planctomycetota bacterium]
MKRSVIVVACLGMSSLAAQGTWQIVPASQTPPGRQGPASAYDFATDRVVVFGGVQGALLFDDTWQFDGTNWVAGTSVAHPSARFDASMAFDSVGQRVLLFGGRNTTGTVSALGDTWSWNGSTWTQLSPPVSPPARAASAMVTDLANNRVLLFGGHGAGSNRFGDTWAWTGATWVQLASSGPSPREHHAMAFDAVRNRCVLFGGWDIASLGDTWEFDGTTWAQPPFVFSPSARSKHAMTFSTTLGGVLLQGGYGIGASDQAWIWNGSSWTWLASGDPVREGHALQWQLGTDRAVLFGGWNYFAGFSSNTWTFQSTSSASFTAFGNGCSGPAGLPQLAPNGANRPWIGHAPQIVAAPVPVFGFLALGTSNTLVGATLLPLSLAAIGMPACDLLVSGEVLCAVAPVGQTATFTLNIPFQPSLVGTEWYTQMLSLDLGANPLGLTVSNGLISHMGRL